MNNLLPTNARQSGAQRSWTITLHKDAQVAVEYLYQPDPNEQPDLALTQPDAPAPLIFTSGGWFSGPIDEKKLAPLGLRNERGHQTLTQKPPFRRNAPVSRLLHR